MYFCPHFIKNKVMGKIKQLQLTDAQRLSLEEGFRNGGTHCFRMRCRAVLLKATSLSSHNIGLQTEMSHISVNSWVKRFEEFGIKGLHTRPGRGRKPIMDCSDEAAVRKAIEQDRQSVSKAREAWQNATGKEASDWTFKRFLSALAQDISE
jgi:transposase